MLKYCEAYKTMRESLCREQGRENFSRGDAECRHVRHSTMVVNQNKQYQTHAKYETSQMQNKDEILQNSSEDVENLVKQFRRQSSRFEDEFTFRPRLNLTSVRMAKERNGRAHEAVERRTTASAAEAEQNFTFKPKVSSKSEKIAQGLKTSFFERQLIHVERQKKMLDSQETMPYSQLPQQRLSPVVRTSRQRKQLNLELSKSEKFQVNTKTANEIEKNALTRSAPDCHTTNKKRGDTKKHLGTNDKVDNTLKYESSLNVSKTQRAKPLADNSPFNCSTENLALKRSRQALIRHKRLKTYPGANNKQDLLLGDVNKDETKPTEGHKKGLTFSGSCSKGQYYNIPLFHRLRQSKEMAETAIKDCKVFVCHGPYPIVRASLRKRGWVEKHFKGCPAVAANRNKQSLRSNLQEKTNSSEDEEVATEQNVKKLSNPGLNMTSNKNEQNEQDTCSYDSLDDNTIWNAGYEAEDCEYSVLSRFCRNATASFFWTCKRDDIDFKFLRKDQVVNHFSKAYSFTTKVGLCSHLRNLSWFENAHSETFFPRCHRLGSDEEKEDFIDDYRVTSACNIIKCFINQSREHSETAIPAAIAKAKSTSCVKTESLKRPSSDDKHQPPKSQRSRSSLAGSEDSSPIGQIPSRAVTLALRACEEFMMRRKNEDIDEVHEVTYLTNAKWQELIGYFHQLIHNGQTIEGNKDLVERCEETLDEMRQYLPQLDLDGVRNVWIVKPGAKSRGRGIMCMDRLQDILKLVSSTVKKENRWIVQKYIECPLLVYNTKFDIRQWFLVTDWNPLTLWFYKDCYFRFCSQEFTLDNFEPCIHLANNSIQKHYQNGVRDERLPENNMWSSDDFREYLRERGRDDLWEEVIYPGMKQAIVYTLECCQITLEARKNSFELYGADFMLSADYKPWLIEINSSPAMSASTMVTRKLCANVIEDTMKVVLDRRDDKCCDTGRFELAFKQPFVDAPPYIGTNLVVSGKAILPNSLSWRRPPSIDRLEKLSRPKENSKLSEPTESKMILKLQKEELLSENMSKDGVRETKNKEEEKIEREAVVVTVKEKNLTLNCPEGRSNEDGFPAQNTKQAPRCLGNGINTDVEATKNWKSVELLESDKKQDEGKNTQLRTLNITSDIKYRHKTKSFPKNLVKHTNRFQSVKKRKTARADHVDSSNPQPRIITIPDVGVPRTILRYTDKRFTQTKAAQLDVGSEAKLRKEPEVVN